MATPHSPNKATIDTNHKKISGPYNSNGPIDIIQINHYFHKSKQEWIERINRGQADGCPRQMKDWDDLIHSANDIEDLTALNFLNQTH
jgi:hypothetical protein